MLGELNNVAIIKYNFNVGSKAKLIININSNVGGKVKVPYVKITSNVFLDSSIEYRSTQAMVYGLGPTDHISFFKNVQVILRLTVGA